MCFYSVGPYPKRDHFLNFLFEQMCKQKHCCLADFTNQSLMKGEQMKGCLPFLGFMAELVWPGQCEGLCHLVCPWGRMQQWPQGGFWDSGPFSRARCRSKSFPVTGRSSDDLSIHTLIAPSSQASQWVRARGLSNHAFENILPASNFLSNWSSLILWLREKQYLWLFNIHCSLFSVFCL